MTRRPPRLVFLTTAAERQMRRWIARRGGTRTGNGSQGIGAPAGACCSTSPTRHAHTSVAESSP
jgi:hypothetical protein